MKITRDVLESYLNCRFKAHLKVSSQSGDKSDYERLLVASRSEVTVKAIDRLGAQFAERDVARNVPVNFSMLRKGPQLVLGANFVDEDLSLEVDGLCKTAGPSKLGQFHYIPALFFAEEKIGNDQRLLLNVCGLLLSRLQGMAPAGGFIWHGREAKRTRVRLSPDLRRAQQLLREVKELASLESPPPRLILNNHCQVCEFRSRCHTEAVAKDDLSLLRSMTETEIRKFAKRGIFTVTQLSCTFHPRRQPKTLIQPRRPHQHALQALAVREKKLFVVGAPEVPMSPTRIYFDIEGDPERRFDYLLGLIIEANGAQTRHSLWSDTSAGEFSLFQQFLDILGAHDDYRLYTYGSYEAAFLRRMFKHSQDPELARILSRLVNVLSVIHSHVYFPTYSNGLKDIGAYLGIRWTDASASGIQSIVWRRQWEQTRSPMLKEVLTIYNQDDCAALKKVTEFLCAICPPDAVTDQAGTVSRVEDLTHSFSRRDWCKVNFAIPDFEFVNDRAYFDYQQDRVFIRTNKVLKKRQKREQKPRGKKGLRSNTNVTIASPQCPHCGSADLTRVADGRLSRLAFDLRVTRSSIRGHIIRFTTTWHFCNICGKRFIPKDYLQLEEFFHGLKSWAMYEHVAHRTSLANVADSIRECFGLPVAGPYVFNFKKALARYYEGTYRRLKEKIVTGPLIHADETEVHLRQFGKGYVWVFTNLEEVVFIYRKSREGEFLHDLLRGFHGVLISDFYAAYDSINCPQQKCLVHLIRDFNQDIRANPWDEELKALAANFGRLLRAVVATIDRHGLKRKHLAKHKRRIDRFFGSCERLPLRSEVTQGYHNRLLKYRDKLFTFIDYDGVPWNNNNAEHAVKQFAYYREYADGLITETGLNEYLVLLSIYLSCKYKRVSFLGFMLSGETDIDVFCARRHRRQPQATIEVHPPDWMTYRVSRDKLAKKLREGVGSRTHSEDVLRANRLP